MQITKIIKTKKFIFGFIFFALITLLIGKFTFFSNNSKTESAAVKKGDLFQELILSGKIDADEHVVLQFQSAGSLSWVGIKEGDYVQNGQAIASLDQQKLEASLRKAWSDFTAAKAESEKIYDQLKGVTSETFDQKISRTAVDAAQNKAYDDTRLIEQDLKNAVIYSPISGVVVNASPSIPGVNISASNLGKYEIVNPNTIFFDVNADQTEIINLKEGMPASIVFDSYPDEKIKGTIKSISFVPKTDETGTVYQIKVSLFGTINNKYKMGMTGDATFVTGRKKDVLYIPIKFVKADEKGKYVFGKNKEKKYVTTGLETEENIEITKGLSKGEVIYD
ncbi:efflux RND transporter periplasmic adaptor subunit [Candidatus Microgenomates bacterium]|nr:MAG: efflux RND transporter periplasmic adaptor subunit [Candidatus Microgenomates bacterium]